MLETFMRLFLEYNQKVNLISRNDSEYLFEKHIYDSLSINLFLQRYVSENKVRMLDIGTGGGFPSIPVAICIDRSDVTAVDSTLKKIKFLEYIKEELALKNLHPVCKRAEELAYRGKFDVSVSRAMSELRVILEYAIPYLKEGGFFAAYKSIKADEEIKNAKNALKVLNCEIVDKIEYKLPIEEENKRVLIIVRKNSETESIYPRKNGMISKKPL
ncbi:16S rRNA (guanine(527)-N(7))-methyltransferase RsmG [bacterium]|nr:16S rRNA (guanine(527)-N(7))-methyltransferase RsmG [bacterium]